MNYTNLTINTIRPADNYIHYNWVNSEQTTCFKKEVLARGAYLALAPASFITSAVDTIIGLGAALATICTLGKHRPTFKVASRQLCSTETLLVGPYVNILHAINPEAKFSRDSAECDGFLIQLIKQPLRNIAIGCYASDNFLKRHVAARLTYALLAVSCLVTRAVDAIIAVPATCLSILTAGKFKTLNNLAYSTLKVPMVIYDLFFCTIKFINPWTGTERELWRSSNTKF